MARQAAELMNDVSFDHPTLCDPLLRKERKAVSQSNQVPMIKRKF
jgi:hypothetical protein